MLRQLVRLAGWLFVTAAFACLVVLMAELAQRELAAVIQCSSLLLAYELAWGGWILLRA